MTSYEQQMLQGLQRIFNLLNTALVPFLNKCSEFFDWIQSFLNEHMSLFYALGFGILIILTLKWLSRW